MERKECETSETIIIQTPSIFKELETYLFLTSTTSRQRYPPQLQMNIIKSNQTLVTSSYISNEDVGKALLKKKECETSNTIIIETRVF